MSGQRFYAGAIWTNHALDRLGQRGLSQEMAATAFQHPDSSGPSKNADAKAYTKSFGKSIVTIIAKQNEKREWIILSCWIDPPLPGTIDSKQKEAYRRYKKASFWEKFWLTLLKQLGL